MDSVTRHRAGFNGFNTSDPEPYLRQIENRRPAREDRTPAPYDYSDFNPQELAELEAARRAYHPPVDLPAMAHADGIDGLVLLVERHGFDNVARWLLSLAPLHGRSL